ncbi:MAG: dicarboxylate/amino acid:cation symporter [bacterium]|nr:dicarboxylate/amino acid:cation symporter [bacterium]
MSEPAEKTGTGFYQRYRKLSIGVKILIFLVIGIVIGLLFEEKALILEPVGELFIRLLMMAAIPLIFFNLLAGLTSLDNIRDLGRLGLRITLYYMFTTITALIFGAVIMLAIKPGEGMQMTGDVPEQLGKVPEVAQVILDLVPENIFNALGNAAMAQVVFFTVFLGIATMLLSEEYRKPLQKGYDILARLFRELVNLILYISPLGIGALAAATVGKYGTAIFGPLAYFISGVWVADALMVIVYLTLLRTITGYSPFKFLKQTAPLYATAAATCSSLASLVVSLDVAEKRVKLPRSIYTFTLPFGSQMNKDGTSIMLISVLLFTSQAVGVEFSIGSLVSMVLIGLFLSTGSGGIPGSGLVVALIFVEAFNLPLEIAIIVGGIYRLIDMGGTVVNCMGDMVGTIIVSHFEKEKST